MDENSFKKAFVVEDQNILLFARGANKIQTKEL